jgi:hypothetical protein
MKRRLVDLTSLKTSSEQALSQAQMEIFQLKTKLKSFTEKESLKIVEETKRR